MPHPIQRSACDRCHGQKLRCMRTASGGACVRCVKARATCTWSPSLRCKRNGSKSEIPDNLSDGQNGITDNLNGLNPRNNVDEGHAPLISVPVDVLCQFPRPETDFNFGTDAIQWSTPLIAGSTSGSSPTLVAFTNSPPQSTSQTTPQDFLGTWQDRFNREWAMLSTEQHPLPKSNIPEDQSELPRLQEPGASGLSLVIIKGLSDLNVDLFLLSSAVPKPSTSTSQPLSWKDKDFAIDKTFQLSQKFIEALDKLYPRHKGSAAIDPVSSPVQGLDFSRPPVQFDQASFLLVLSCYQRLIETYDDIFGNMQACLDRSAITAPEDYVPMPDMKVGSFSLPNSSALQITLVLQLARHLIKRMEFIIKALDQSRNLTSCDTNDLMSLTFKAVNSRESDLVGRINKLRNTLVSLDIL
ncbi:hypothetical protein M434DRAFT_11202 [Hypoxylon sp. CO27-5]|nr:hypothetical protein M434DRAFT_11202 [Hypoxylon sp. CO27-5]